MSRVEAEISGEAIFGTVQGLEVLADGLLAGESQAGGLFEFGFGRNHDGALHRTREARNVVFRRRGIVDGRQSFEMVGYLHPGLDFFGRRGFFGSAVSFPIDSRRGDIRIQDWELPFFAAAELRDMVGASLENDRLLTLPHQAFPRTDQRHRNRQLSAGSGGDLYLVSVGVHSGDPPQHELLQAASALHPEATIFVFEEEVEGGVDLRSGEILDMVGELRRLAGQSHSPRRPRNAPARTGSASPARPTGGPDEGPGLADLESRVAELEREVAWIIAHGRPRGGPAVATDLGSSSGSIGRGLSMFEEAEPRWPQLLIWGFGAAVVAAAVAGVLILTFRPDLPFSSAGSPIVEGADTEGTGEPVLEDQAEQD